MSTLLLALRIPASLFLLAGLLPAPPSARYAREPDLVLRLDARVCWLSDRNVQVPFALQNISKSPVRVSQYPGLSLRARCIDASGTSIGGLIPGLLVPALTLPEFHRYTVVLPSGAALYGSQVVSFPSSCSSRFTIDGTFESFAPYPGPPGSPQQTAVVAPGVQVDLPSPLVVQGPHDGLGCPVFPLVY